MVIDADFIENYLLLSLNVKFFLKIGEHLAKLTNNSMVAPFRHTQWPMARFVAQPGTSVH